MTFPEWLKDQLLKRGWNQARLTRESGIDRALLSRLLKGERNPGPMTCRAIAKAFDLSEELVFHQAGLITERGENAAGLMELTELYLSASENERVQILEFARRLKKEK